MFLVADQQLSRCERVMQQRVEPHVYTPAGSCTLRSFDNPGEPEPSSAFLERVRQGQVDFKPFSIPGLWGTTWGTTWFEVSGHVDLEAVAGKQVELVIDLGWLGHRGPGFQAEGLVYRADGTAIKSANPRNHWIPLISADGKPTCDIDGHGDFTVYIEAAANPFVEGPTPYAPTNLGERATGKVEEPYTFRKIDVSVFDSDVYGYLMDLETVSSLIRELKDDDPRYWQLAKALQRSLNAYDERDLSTVAQARHELEGVLAEPASSSVIRHVAIGHAHIDSAWLWPVRETQRKVARTVSNVLALMDDDPEFKYAMSSAQQYAWLEEGHPDLFKRMLERVKEGRFIPVGGMWVESDGMIPAGESLVRQISFGRRYFKEHLGVEPRGIWLPDSFGYNGSWPQIARRAGYDWFLTQKISWNDTTKFPHHSFMWEGIDGTPILTHFPPSDTYGASVSMHEVMYSQKNFLDKDLSRNAIMLYGYGDGGGGPTREMNSRIHRLQNLNGAPRVDFGSPDELFDMVREDIVDHAQGETPVYQGEFYLELHRGTLTAQQDMKRGCRLEESLLRTVEYLCAAASIKDPAYSYPRQDLDSIWKTMLLNQFHDILPGSAIAWVHRQAREEYLRDLGRLEAIAQEAAQAIGKTQPQIARVGNAMIPAYDGVDSWRVRQADGFAAECKTVAVSIESAEQCEPRGGETRIQGRPVAVDSNPDGSVILGNDMLRVRVEPDGTVSSVIDKSADCRELVPKGTRMGRYELMKDEPYNWDAWDIQRDAFLTARGLEESRIESSESLPDGSAKVRVLTQAKGVRILTEISLLPQSHSLDFKAQVDWRACEQFLKVDMPVAIQAVNAQYECQYGLIERPIQKNSRSEEAKFESCTHRFVRIADASYAAAVVNATTYGSDVLPIRGRSADTATLGSMVRLSLLSAPLYPDPHTDQGMHAFAWSLVADAGMDRVLSSVSRLNTPVLPELPAFEPLAQVESIKGLIVLDWVKLADDGSGDLILRLYEAAGGQASGRLHLTDELKDCTLEEVDLMEGGELPADLNRALAPDHVDTAEGAVLTFEPFQLATLRIRR
ncbi:alpha-mannosidase [Bifidobacterium aemilianum]|uniref:Alpha-mannosidase n=1 Tax=Bifidobacterium aemilianum TaxID=2493120 RepID=A0A366KBP5_9BIFI|nr:alpha-mannosidase [Bifidobacterium aemilianum]RBP98543.1 alpha-mannosidase [Bifidobacterium aemilianum]